ncbi:hypothetical protein EDD21DRAFT_384596 [Dissophora ornata]|nr:hypothetical protein EDD21DRAFT_384596 [Dissophora ornata]
MNALIALAVWCQPHGPATVLITQHRRPNGSSYSALRNGSSSNKDSAANNMSSINTNTSSKDTIPNTNPNTNSNDTPSSEPPNKPSVQHGSTHSDDPASTAPPSKASPPNSTSHPSLDTQTAAATTTAIPATTTTVTSSSSSSSPSSSSNTPSLESKRSRRSLHQPSPSEPCPSPMGRPASAHPTLNSNSCECQFSVPSGENSIHSVDPINNELSYISQPVPVDTSLFAPIRVACIRAYVLDSHWTCWGRLFVTARHSH